MSLISRMVAAIQAIAADIKIGKASVGTLASLTTTDKGSVVAALNEVVLDVSNKGVKVQSAKPTPTKGAEWFNQVTGRSFVAAEVDGGGYVWVEASNNVTDLENITPNSNIDGGGPSTNYGGSTPIIGGGPFTVY